MPSTLGSLPVCPLALLLVTPLLAQQTTLPSPSDTPFPAAPTQAASPYTADAHTGIRIVRLSQARGDVQMDRGTAEGFERAFANFPIVSGARLRTRDGLAEVEFEDNSSLRLAPDTLVHFSTLSRDHATGATSTVVTVLQGTVFASVVKHERNPLTLAVGSRTFALSPGSHLRLAVDQPALHLAVLDGTVGVQSANGPNVTVSKGHGLAVVAANPEIASLTGKEANSDGLALWDRRSVDFHQSTSNLSAFAGNGLYGANDLNYYGSFVSMPGCGSMWRPYFASASWNPFGYGAWAFYPGAGYTFVSPYPWAWTPFHTGAWQQCGSAGWGWSPYANGSWAGLNNASLVASTTSKNPSLHPPLPPVHGQSGIVVVTSVPLTYSTISAEHTFVFAQDSAGLGVPRQTFGNLRDASSLVAQHGSANLPVEIDSRALPATGQMRSAVALSALRPTPSAVLSSGVHPVAGAQESSPNPAFTSPSATGSTHAVPSSSPTHTAGSSSSGHASK